MPRMLRNVDSGTSEIIQERNQPPKRAMISKYTKRQIIAVVIPMTRGIASKCSGFIPIISISRSSFRIDM